MEFRTYLRVLFKYWWLVLIAFVVTLGFTAWFTFSQEPVYESSATYIVRPTLSSETENAKDELSGLDVLGRRGDIASTFAEMASSRQIKARAAENLGLSASQKSGLSVSSQLVSGTYLLKITVEGYDPALARDFANMVGVETISFVEDLYMTYELVSLDPATQSSSPSKPNKMLNLALGAALGLVLGAVLAFLAYYLQSPFEAATSPAVPAEVPASPAVPAEAAAIPVVLAEAPASHVAPAEAPTSHTAPAEATAGLVVSEEVLASDTEERGEEGEELPSMQEGVVGGDRAVPPKSPPARRSIVAWIAAAVLTVVLIVAASAVWFSGRGTSAASLPAETATAPLALTAIWTSTAVARPTNTAMPTAVPNATDTMEPPAMPTMEEPSATPTAEPSATPTAEPSTTPTVEPSATPTAEPSEIPTTSSTATATTVPSRTPTDTPSPAPRSTESSPLPTKPAATSTLFPAPELLAPLDRQDFQQDAEVVLTWQPVGALSPDAYYVITVAYSHLGDTWFDDVPWTRDTSWTLSEHSYLQDLSDDGQFWWSVQVVRQTGTDGGGKPTGVPLSAQSEEWMLIWQRASSGSGGTEKTPSPPPP